jgi:DNA-binding beta-propeller fold protein YncE
MSLGLANAHPGSGIVVDAQGQVYFVDTGRGVWRIDTQGKLTLLHTIAYHWMALDENGHFARTDLGEVDGGSFERATPAGAIPALVISSDYPVVVGRDGALHYVPYKPGGPRELVRRTPSGQRSILARLPAVTAEKPMHWVNGIATGSAGSLYVTDNDAIRRIDPDGNVSTFRDAIRAPHCADPLPETPKLPYLRGLAVHPDGSIYAAASGCRTVLRIPATGSIRTVLTDEVPWSPTGVAIAGRAIYVLSYLHAAGEDRKAWTPRVAKIAADGAVTTLATIDRQKQ